MIFWKDFVHKCLIKIRWQQPQFTCVSSGISSINIFYRFEWSTMFNSNLILVKVPIFLESHFIGYFCELTPKNHHQIGWSGDNQEVGSKRREEEDSPSLRVQYKICWKARIILKPLDFASYFFGCGRLMAFYWLDFYLIPKSYP